MIETSVGGRGFFAYFFTAYRWRSVGAVVLVLIGSIAEGIGVLTLLPLLQILTGHASTTGLSGPFLSVLKWAHLGSSAAPLVAVITALIILKGAFLWLGMRQIGYTIAYVASDLRLQLLEAIFGARWTYLTGVQSGVFTNAIGSEVMRASGAYRRAILLIASLLEVAVYATISLLVSWQATVYAVLSGGLMLLVLRSMIGVSRRAGEAETRVMKSVSNRLTNALQNMKTIKAMAQEEPVMRLLAQETDELNRAQRRDVNAIHTVAALQEPVVVLMLALGLGAATFFGGQPVSSLLLMALLFYRLLSYVNKAHIFFQEMRNMETAFHSFRATLDTSRAESEKWTGQRPAPPLASMLRLVDVTFGYGDVPILAGVDMTVQSGRLVSLVGVSGAGKTTLIDLIMGLLKPDAGTILVDGVDLQDIDLVDWRSQVGYVPQEPLLFHESVAYNVALGDETITSDRIWRSLELAGASDFVARMPGGLSASVGERGLRLSGGQRQRIAIARALVREPRLLVLDEVTSSLDPDTEQDICDTLLGLVGIATMISISHQPSIVEISDAVYELAEGKLHLIRAGSTHPVG